MTRKPHYVLPFLALVAACGGGQDITVTNENNVVLNDALENVAFTNDGEMTNQMAQDQAAMNAMPMDNAAMPSNDAMMAPTSNAM